MRINPQETKRGKESGAFPQFTLVCRMAWPVLYDMLYVVFSWAHRSLTSLFWSAHVGFSVEQVRDIQFFFIHLGDPWTIFEPNLPQSRYDPSLTISSHRIHYRTNHLWKWEFTTSPGPPPLQWEPGSRWSRSLLERLIQGLKAKTNVASVRLGLYVLH